MSKTNSAGVGEDFWSFILKHIEPFDGSTCSKKMILAFFETHPSFRAMFLKEVSLPKNRQWKEDVKNNKKVFCILNLHRVSGNFYPNEAAVIISRVGKEDYPTISLNYY